MKNYKAVKNYLDSFINYEKKPFFPYKRSLKLQRVRKLFECLNIAYSKLNVIHIAGTKGKGSTAQFCSHILASSGMKIGLYTSPHFFDIRERITIKSLTKDNRSSKLMVKDKRISKEAITKIVNKIKAKLDKLKEKKAISEVTFFELLTASAFKYFIEKGVDLAVLETGLGGRLDATNIAKPSTCIITHIGFDHTDKLGKSLEEIAYEKAGIIKKGIPVVSAHQRRQVLREIKKRCKKVKAPLYVLGRDFSIKNVRMKTKYTVFDFIFGNVRLKNVKIKLKGKHQVENAACALAAIILLKKQNLITQHIELNNALSDVYFGGRFDIERSSPLIITDIAHNPSSFLALSDTIKAYFPKRRVILVFAASSDKDIMSMLQNIDFSYIIFTAFSSPRAMSPWQLRAKTNMDQALIADNIGQALALAKKLYTKDSLIIISGSFFLVSEAKRLLKSKKYLLS